MAKALAESVDPELAPERWQAARGEIVARVLSVVTWALARARGLVDEARPTTFDELERATARLGPRGRPPFRPHAEGPLFDHLASRAIRARAEVLTRAWRTVDEALSRTLDVEVLGAVYEELVGWELVRAGDRIALGPSDARRRAGAHFTPRSVTTHVVELAAAPVVGRDPLDVLVCDPAMGSGAFLVAACRFLAQKLRTRSPRTSEREALRRVAERCLHGVDSDAVAVDVARVSLWLLVASRSTAPDFAARALLHGDALVGTVDVPGGAASNDTETRAFLEAHPGLAELVHPSRADALERVVPLHWGIALPDAMKRKGFDVVVGNPPWVSYAGRAAQPLRDELRDYYGAAFRAFAGYRNLQALFVERALALLRPGGRLGLVLPTSMSDLGGYEPSRRAHDTWAIADAELPDLEDGGFEGVFQPCMALLSTKRRAAHPVERAGPWPLARHDLDPPSRALLAELGALPTLPAHLFGERGFQSTSDDVKRFTEGPVPPSSTPLRVGGEVSAFRRRTPVLHCDPARLGGRLRSPEAFREVAFYVRQTARWPMAALSDGLAFRNSILAGFADDTWSAPFLVAYLNSSPVRFYHYMRHRDARQGMPQMKIAHLRALPAPPEPHPMLARLRAFGERLSAENRGIDADEQAELDTMVADLLGIGAEGRATIAAWQRAHARPG
jgi:hypothetical protein